jgi:hypothetical protein
MNFNSTVFVAVVLILGLALLACVGGIIFLSSTGDTIPDILQNISSAVVAGLIGILVQKDSRNA